MTKRQLIQMLENIPGDAMQVVIWDPDAEGPMPVTCCIYRSEDGMTRWSCAPECEEEESRDQDAQIYLYSDNQEGEYL